MADWRVLVADDEPYVVLAISEVLEGLPASVLTAHDGEEALRLARGERLDLILLDVKMPGLDGFQVATALKRTRQRRASARLLQRARGAQRKGPRLELGADDYVTKPIDAEELKARVRTILRRNRPSKRPSLPGSGQLQAVNLASLVASWRPNGGLPGSCLPAATSGARSSSSTATSREPRRARGKARPPSMTFSPGSRDRFRWRPWIRRSRSAARWRRPIKGCCWSARRQEQVAGLKARLAVVKGLCGYRTRCGTRSPGSQRAPWPRSWRSGRGASAGPGLGAQPLRRVGTLKTLLRLLTIGGAGYGRAGFERRGGCD